MSTSLGGWPTLSLHLNSSVALPSAVSEGGRRQHNCRATALKLSGSLSQPATYVVADDITVTRGLKRESDPFKFHISSVTKASFKFRVSGCE